MRVAGGNGPLIEGSEELEGFAGGPLGPSMSSRNLRSTLAFQVDDRNPDVRMRKSMKDKPSSPTIFQNWIESEKPILADGALGTMLHMKGISIESCFDELNLTNPNVVLEIHQAYVNAGVQIIETNTFGANRYKLSEYRLENRVHEINVAAVKIAKKAAQSVLHDVLVAGSVGPLGVRLAPLGRIKESEAFAAFQEQIAALVSADVDLIIIETQNDLQEAIQAVRAARSVTDRPIIATMTFTRDDRTLLGETPEHVAATLYESGADVIGANCSEGPAQLLRIIRKMKQAVPQAVYSVMPNAGWPERIFGRIMYPATPDYFSEYARAFQEAGAKIIGGCCGTTPEHSAAMRASLDNPDQTSAILSAVISSTENSFLESTDQQPTNLADKLDNDHFVIAVEMHPPRGFSTYKMIAGAELLLDSGADVINLADSPMARMRMSPWAACQLIQNEVGVETVLHFPTRGRNILRVQGDLLASHALGVRNVFVVMGDPTAIGDYPGAMDNYDLVPSGLIKLISQGFNTGVDHAGAQIGGETSFFVGCALNLGAKNQENEMRVLNRKIKAGANFALTQPVYDPKIVEDFLSAYAARYGALELPLLLGMLPIHNPKHAAFLHNEVPGINIPQQAIERISAAGENSREEGVRLAINLFESVRNLVQGVYLIPAFGHYNVVADLIENIRAYEIAPTIKEGSSVD